MLDNTVYSLIVGLEKAQRLKGCPHKHVYGSLDLHNPCKVHVGMAAEQGPIEQAEKQD